MRDKLTIELIATPVDTDYHISLRLWAEAVAVCIRRNIERGRYAVNNDGLVICATMEPKIKDGSLDHKV